MEVKLTGRAASPGTFAGPAARLSGVATVVRRHGSAAEEEAALLAAIAASREELSRLASVADGDRRGAASAAVTVAGPRRFRTEPPPG